MVRRKPGGERLQQREQLTAHAVSQIARVGVGRILSPRLVGELQGGARFPARDRQQRADDVGAGARYRKRGNSGHHEAGGTCAAQPGDQVRLHLVVKRVTSGDAIRTERAYGVRQKPVACGARRFLGGEARRAPAGARVRRSSVEREAQLAGETLDEGGVAVRLGAPPAVVEVGDVDGAGEYRCQGMQRVEEEDRVGAARDGGEDGSARWEEAVVAAVTLDAPDDGELRERPPASGCQRRGSANRAGDRTPRRGARRR